MISEQLDLSLQQALTQIERLDRTLARALKSKVDLDTTLATTKVTKLREAATAAFRKQLVVNLNTNEARLKLIRLETLVKDVRKRISSPIQFNLGTSEAAKKLAALHRAATAVRNTVRETNAGVGGKKSTTATEPVVEQQALNRAIERFNSIVPASIILAGEFTDRLRNQAIAAGVLSGEMKSIAGSMAAFNAASSGKRPPILGPGRAELREVLKAEKAAAAGVGRNAIGDLLGPIDAGRIASIKAQTKEVEDAAKNASRAVQKLGFDAQGINQQFIAAGRSLTALFTLPTLIAGAFAAFNEFKFQETINRIRILTDAFKGAEGSIEQVRTRTAALRGVFNDIAIQTGNTPQSVAEGFYFVASAGGAAATRMSILRVAAQGAAIGLGTVEVVADALTSVLNAYGEANITAASAGDILVRAVNDAKVEADEFAPQLGRILPIAAALGIKFEAVASALATLTQNGNNAAVASTQLRGILQTLIRPTSQKAADILASAGLDTASLRAAIESGGPTGLIDVLAKLRFESDLSLEQISQLFRRVDAFNGFLALTDDVNATRTAMLGVHNAAENVTGDLDEFAKFTQANDALKLRQGFAQLLTTLQPLGQKVLPILVDAMGTVNGLFTTFADLLGTPVLGSIAKVTIGILAVAGPLLIIVGRVRQVEQSFRRLQLATQFKGGFGAFLGGASIQDLQRQSGEAITKVSLLGRTLGALPGLIGLAGAGMIAFFAGSALGADGLKNKIVGVVGGLTAMALGFGAARSAAQSFGVTSSLALGAIGVASALLIGGIAVWQAYEQATSKSRKALEEFQGSLEGLTANEAVTKFGASLTKSLEGITGDDRITEIEIPELKAALTDLGLSYDKLGKKLATIVLTNPDDLNAQRLALKELADGIGGITAGGRLEQLQGQLDGVNEALTGSTFQIGTDADVTRDEIDLLTSSLEGLGLISDETGAALSDLAAAGLVEASNGSLVLTGTLDEMRAALGDSLGPDVLGLLDKFAEAFRQARQVALDTTGEFTFATNAAGSFIETLDEDGTDTVIEFQSAVEETRESLAGLRDEFDQIIASIFGLEGAVDLGVLKDNLVDVRKQLHEAVTEALSEFELDDEGKVPKAAKDRKANKNFINFSVGLTGEKGQPVRQFLREQLANIDKELQPFLTGPEADIEVGLRIRDQEVANLAREMGLTVEDVNRFLKSDPALSTLELRTELTAADVAGIQDKIATYQKLLDDSPLSLDVKTEIKGTDADKQTALFGSRLLELASQGGSSQVIDFVMRAQADGVPIDVLQNLFGDAESTLTKSIIIQALNEGTPVEEISALLAAFPGDIRRQLTISLGFDKQFSADPDVAFLLGDVNQRNVTISAALEGADEIETLLTEVSEPVDLPVVVDPQREEFDNIVAEIEKGATWRVLVDVDPFAYQVLLARVRRDVSRILNPTLPGGPLREGATGMIVGPAGKQMALGGYVDGRFMARVPMIARAPRGMKGILWGEPQTHKEGYVSYNPIHRGRSKMLLSKMAADFGMEVTDKAGGSMRMAATGGIISMPSASRSSGGGGGVATLAREVASLAAVVASREQAPLIGEFHSNRQVGNDQAAAAYWASDVAAIADRVLS